MKTLNRFYAPTILTVLSLFVLSACGGGGGGGPTSPATGTFTKTVVLDGLVGRFSGFFRPDGANRNQFLYRAQEVAGSGSIQSISLRHITTLATAVNCPNVTILMGHTSLADLTTTYADNVQQGKGSHVTILNNAAVTIPAGAAGDFYTIALDTPFHYNGVDNLVVEIVGTSACSAQVVTAVAPATVAYTATLSHISESAPVTGTSSILLPDAKFNFAGGDNEQNFGGILDNSWPFSDETPRSQNLYLASEIDGSGPITGFAFQMNEVSTAQTYTATITMGHSTLASLGIDFAANYSDTPVTVANEVTFNIPAGIPIGEWFWVPLPNATFAYNGTDNFIVDVAVSVGFGKTLLRDASSAGRRASNIEHTATIATEVDSFVLHAKLRFNGGTMDVITDGVESIGIPVGVGNEFIAQILYDSTALGTGGEITSLGFRLAEDAVAFDHTDVNLVLGHTTLSALGGASLAANIQSDRTAAFSGTISIPAGLKAGDWVQVPLSTPFTYNPTQNLVVQWDAPVFATANDSIAHSLSTGRYVDHVQANGDRASDVSVDSGDTVLDMRLILNNK